MPQLIKGPYKQCTLSVLVRLLLPRAAGRHREDAGAEPHGRVHVRAEHDGRGAESALLATGTIHVT